MTDNKKQLDVMVVKHYPFLLKTCRYLLYKHSKKEEAADLLNFCILQLYNQLDNLNEKVLTLDKDFQNYTFMILDNTLRWQNSKFNRERRIISQVELPEYMKEDTLSFDVDLECPDCTPYIKESLFDLYNTGRNLEDISIYIQIEKFRSTLKGHELILFDEHILKGKSILKICREIKVTVSQDYLYQLTKNMKQKLKNQFNEQS